MNEEIDVDDLITSHMLKSCLIAAWGNKEEHPALLGSNVVDISVTIYQILEKNLEAKMMKSWPKLGENSIRLFDCTSCSRDTNGCCMKRKLILDMTKKIIHWLNENKENLAGMEF